MSGGEERDGVPLTNLDQELFAGADATKRDLVDYLDAVSDLIIGQLRDKPLSVIRVLRGQQPFMQKNVPKYTPDFVRTVHGVGGGSHREVAYALCNDRRTLLWFANQRAVEYHPTLMRAGQLGQSRVPGAGPRSAAAGGGQAAGAFGQAVHAALAVRDGARRGRPGRRRQDQRRQGRARVRPAGARARPASMRRRPPGRSRREPSCSIRNWPRRPSSGRTAAARCSSTRPGPAARPWWPRTARGSGPAPRSRSRSAGTTSAASSRGTSRCATRRGLLAGQRPLGRVAARAAAAAR